MKGAKPSANEVAVTRRFHQEFAGRDVSIELPSELVLMQTSQGQAGAPTLAFSTPPRPDGTRALVEITLLDLASLSRTTGDLGAARLNPEALLRTMVKGVAGRRRVFMPSGSGPAVVAGVAARRLEWTATLVANKGVERRTRGVMFAGRKGTLGFSLHAEDTEPTAAAFLVVAERALRTFAIADTATR